VVGVFTIMDSHAANFYVRQGLQQKMPGKFCSIAKGFRLGQ
jgi:hypothetical protein